MRALSVHHFSVCVCMHACVHVHTCVCLTNCGYGVCVWKYMLLSPKPLCCRHAYFCMEVFMYTINYHAFIHVLFWQYPKGLGSTVSELDISNAVCTVPKTKFSMVLPEVEGTLKTLCEGKVEHIVIFGIEVGKLTTAVVPFKKIAVYCLQASAVAMRLVEKMDKIWQNNEYIYICIQICAVYELQQWLWR